MNEEKIRDNVDKALDVKTFNVLDYLEDQPVARDEVEIFTHTAKARQLHKLMNERTEILAQRRIGERETDTSGLSIVDLEEDTELDDEINELLKELRKTAVTFSLKTVAPKLIKAIEKEGEAKAKASWTDDQKEKHRQKTLAKILARSIDSVKRGDGAVDETEWDADRLLQLEEALYVEQAQQLISALYDIVYTGRVFDESITVDF